MILKEQDGCDQLDLWKYETEYCFPLEQPCLSIRVGACVLLIFMYFYASINQMSVHIYNRPWYFLKQSLSCLWRKCKFMTVLTQYLRGRQALFLSQVFLALPHCLEKTHKMGAIPFGWVWGEVNPNPGFTWDGQRISLCKACSGWRTREHVGVKGC